jgi:hypothetical protein
MDLPDRRGAGRRRVPQHPIELLPDTSTCRASPSAQLARRVAGSGGGVPHGAAGGAIQQVRGVETSRPRSARAAASDQRAVRPRDGHGLRAAGAVRAARLAGAELPVGRAAAAGQMYVPDEFREQRSRCSATPSPARTCWSTCAVRGGPDPAGAVQVDGVGEVRVDGGRARVLEIELDEHRIQALGLRPQDVAAAIAQMEIVREAGRSRAPTAAAHARHPPARRSADESPRCRCWWMQRPRRPGGDVARVYDTYEEPQQPLPHRRPAGRRHGGVQAPRQHRGHGGLGAKARIAELEASLPTGMRVILDRDQSVDIRGSSPTCATARHRRRHRAARAAAVPALLRAAIIVFATVAFAGPHHHQRHLLRRLTLNLLTLMGLAMGFGLVVDNAIVVLENIYRRRRRGEEAPEAAERGHPRGGAAHPRRDGHHVVVLSRSSTCRATCASTTCRSPGGRAQPGSPACSWRSPSSRRSAPSCSARPGARRGVRRRRHRRRAPPRLLPPCRSVARAVRRPDPRHAALAVVTPSSRAHARRLVLPVRQVRHRGRLWGGGGAASPPTSASTSAAARRGAGAHGRAGALLRGPAAGDAGSRAFVTACHARRTHASA